MAEFSISLFKKSVQDFIHKNKIDDGNGVIESENGELSKVLSNFILEESQIGDLLIKSDNSVNKTKSADSAEKPSSADIHNDFIEAYKIYDNMTTEQKKNVREQTVQKAEANYEIMLDALRGLSLEPLYDSLSDLPNIDGDELKVIVAAAVRTYADKQHKQMTTIIKQYDTAFSEYDVTYRSPFEVKQSIMVSPDNNIADEFKSQVLTKLIEYLSEDTSSLTAVENLDLVNSLINKVNSLQEEKANYIKTKGDKIAESYKNDLVASLEELKSDNPQLVPWNPPLDGQPHEEEPEYIAIKGSPVKKTFTDVVNEVVKNISSIENISPIETDNNQTPIYDLSGKAVTGDLQKDQIYIQNGKKFVVQ